MDIINNNKPNIILDIDETLIHTKIYSLSYITFLINSDNFTKQNSLKKYPELNNIINDNISNDKLYLTNFIIDKNIYIVLMRPYLIEFISNINKYFNIHIYSLGTYEYVNNILIKIFDILGYNPFNKIIANNSTNNRFYKKKSTLLNIGYSNLLIIDDRSDVWSFDKHNLYKIKPYNKPYEITSGTTKFCERRIVPKGTISNFAEEVQFPKTKSFNYLNDLETSTTKVFGNFQNNDLMSTNNHNISDIDLDNKFMFNLYDINIDYSNKVKTSAYTDINYNSNFVEITSERSKDHSSVLADINNDFSTSSDNELLYLISKFDIYFSTYSEFDIFKFKKLLLQDKQQLNKICN